MRKKLISIIILVMLVLHATSAGAFAATLTWTLGDEMFTIDDRSIASDVQPLLKENGVLIVPLRTIVENMGGRIHYDQEANSIRLEMGAQWAEISIGNEPAEDFQTGLFGDTVVDIGTFEDGHIYLPLSLTAYCIGAKMYVLENENGLPYRFILHVRAV